MRRAGLETFEDLHRTAARLLDRAGPHLGSPQGRALLAALALVDGDDLLSGIALQGRAADFAVLFWMRERQIRFLPSKN